MTLATQSLAQDRVVAVPTDTIYGFAALAQSDVGIDRLYRIKQRDYSKPIAICVSEVDDIYRWEVHSSNKWRSTAKTDFYRYGKVTVPKPLLSSLLPGPVTVVFERTELLNPLLNPNTHLIGIRVPNFPFVRDIARRLNQAIALTSANVTAEKSPVVIEVCQCQRALENN